MTTENLSSKFNYIRIKLEAFFYVIWQKLRKILLHDDEFMGGWKIKLDSKQVLHETAAAFAYTYRIERLTETVSDSGQHLKKSKTNHKQHQMCMAVAHNNWIYKFVRHLSECDQSHKREK